MEAWQLIVATLPTTIDPIPTPDAAAKTLEQRNSNANLIAAAPELLAALHKVADCSRYLPSQGDDLVFALETLRSIAREAIAKAEGREG